MDRRFGKKTVNDLETCPYNPAHRVESGPRMQRHLIECSKDYPNVEEVPCKFNFTHRVKAPEYAHHLKTCPDRYMVERELIHVSNKGDMKFREKLPNPNETILPPATENWEDELLPAPVTIPSIHNNKGVKFINSDNLSGLKPAQKKQFRKNLWQGKTTWLDDEAEENGLPSQQKPQQQYPAVTQANKQMRVPSRESRAAQLEPMLEQLHMGRGRGLRNPAAPSRIAANIFGRVDPLPHEQALQYGLAGIGRGTPLTVPKAAAFSNFTPAPAPAPAPAAVPVMTPPMATSLPSPIMLTMAPPSVPREAEERSPPPQPLPTPPPEVITVSSPKMTKVSKENKKPENNTNHDDTSADPALKWKKKLEKKLKQIQKLEDRQAAGEILNEDELEKLSLKDTLLQDLTNDEDAERFVIKS